jgi:hypothetical protein
MKSDIISRRAVLTGVPAVAATNASKPAPEKPALKVIEGYKGPPLPRRPKPSSNEASTSAQPFILPPVQIPQTNPPLYYGWMGMTQRQVNLAFQCACVSHLSEIPAAINRVFDARLEYEAAINAERDMLLAAMLVKYPAAARRIMKKLQRN